MLKPEHFSFKCPLKLSDLDRVDGGYFCSQCRKDIHDLTDCSLDEVRDLQRRKGSICGFVRLVGVTSMLSLAACSKGGKDGSTAGENPAQPPNPPEEHPVLMGDICVPEPPAAPPPTPPAAPPSTEDSAPTAPPAGNETEPEEPSGPILMGKICPPQGIEY